MGNCLISVHATGAHHNGLKSDLDQMAADFVQKLKAAGHNVTGATILTGGEYDLQSAGQRFPIRDV
jgi:hypothetical protein